MHFLSSTSLTLLLNICLADAKPLASGGIKPTVSVLENPGLDLLTSVNATVGALYDFGAGPYGKREIATITGGTATGPKLNGTAIDRSLDHFNEAKLQLTLRDLGTVLNLGANWLLGDTKGHLHPDARAALHTDDGAYIYVQLTGSGPGIKIGSVTYTTLMLETSSEKYWWLNDIVAVSQMSVAEAWVGLDVWYLPGSATKSS